MAPALECFHTRNYPEALGKTYNVAVDLGVYKVIKIRCVVGFPSNELMGIKDP